MTALRTGAEDRGKRLDAFLAEQLPEVTRSAAQRLIAQGMVLVEGQTAAKSCKLTGEETVEVTLPEPEPTEAVAQDIPLDVVYEDQDVVVVNKPVGMVVHPAPGHPDGTLVNALLHHCGGSLSGIGGQLRPWRPSFRTTPWPGPTRRWWWATSGRTGGPSVRPSAATTRTGRRWPSLSGAGRRP